MAGAASRWEVLASQGRSACVATHRTAIGRGIVPIEVPEPSTENQGNPLYCRELKHADSGNHPFSSMVLQGSPGEEAGGGDIFG